jgi:hypothetical protein
MKHARLVILFCILMLGSACSHTSTRVAVHPRNTSTSRPGWSNSLPTETSIATPPSTALDRQHVHASLQLDAVSVQSGASVGATVSFVNDTGDAVRVPGCFSFFQVVIGDVHGPFGAGWRGCLQYFTVPTGTSSQPAKLWARSQSGSGGTVPAYPPGRYYAFLVFDEQHPQVVAPAPVPIQVVGPVRLARPPWPGRAPTATTP